MVFLVVSPEDGHEEDEGYHVVYGFYSIGNHLSGPVVEDLQQFASQEDEVSQLQQDKQLYKGRRT